MLETRSTTRRAARIRSYADSHSLRETAIRFRIVDPEGRPSKGLVAWIKKGWIPHTPDCRKRCGFPPRPRRKMLRPVTINQMLNLPIQDTPPEILAWQLENREEMR